MIMSTFKLICVTNRNLCQDPFLERLAALAKRKDISHLILREKDLPMEEYLLLAKQVAEHTAKKLILHTYPQACEAVCIKQLHLPLALLQQHPEIRKQTDLLGVSVHSEEEAALAEQLGVDYLIAGHIFPTSCKPGVPARGLEFLTSLCRSTPLPVYAIGGITPQKLELVENTGAAGACMMQYFMQCPLS